MTTKHDDDKARATVGDLYKQTRDRSTSVITRSASTVAGIYGGLATAVAEGANGFRDRLGKSQDGLLVRILESYVEGSTRFLEELSRVGRRTVEDIERPREEQLDALAERVAAKLRTSPPPAAPATK